MKERKPTAVIVDCDGTLFDVSSVRHHVMQKPKNFHAFHTEALDCPPIPDTLEWIAEQHAAGHAIVVVTARMSSWFHETSEWLRRHVPVPYYGPMMRPFRDYRPDFEIKSEILAHMRGMFDVVAAIDDNPAVIALWESHGIPTTRVPGWDENGPYQPRAALQSEDR